MKINIYSRIAIAFFVYLLIVHFYIGLTSLPTEGDSIVYHIPIAKAIISGKVVDPSTFQASPFLKYSPASSELLLSPLVYLGIPLNVYNVFAVLALFFASYFVGKRFGLRRELSIVFAVTICSLNVIVRWMNTQIIDIWVLVFFLTSLGLLAKPEKNIRYFVFLGVSIGMLCGTKFTGPIFSAIFLLFYFRKILSFLNIQRVFAFVVPFILLGLSWYMRNYFLTGNPIYPQPLLGLPGGGKEFSILSTQVWRILSTYPVGFLMTINAYISEYMIWTLALFVSLFYVIRVSVQKRTEENFIIIRLFLIGLLIFILFLFLPSALEEHIAVSVFRYSYSAFSLFILCVFLISQKYKKEELLCLISFSSIFFLGFPLTYHPKLVFISIPITLFIIYFKDVKQFTGGFLSKYFK